MTESLADLLREALEMMRDEEGWREQSLFDLACGSCEAGGRFPHSFGCRAESALKKAEKNDEWRTERSASRD